MKTCNERPLTSRPTVRPGASIAETKMPRHQARQVSIFSSYVEHRGLEPLTYCLQSSRATNCANAPWTSIV